MINHLQKQLFRLKIALLLFFQTNETHTVHCFPNSQYKVLPESIFPLFYPSVLSQKCKNKNCSKGQNSQKILKRTNTILTRQYQTSFSSPAYEQNHVRKQRSKSNSRAIAVSALITEPTSKRRKKHDFAVQRLENDDLYTNLESRDRSFARLLVATVERRMGQLDAILSSMMDRYPPKKGKHASLLQTTLRVGAAQLLFLDTPPHAAIKETVDVLKQQGGPNQVPEPMIKFVNAVLRSISRKSKEELLHQYSSPTMNVAPWLIDEWERHWGAECTERMAEQLMHEPHIDISVKLPHELNHNDRLIELEKIRSQFDSIFQLEKNQDETSTNTKDGSSTVLLPHGMIRTKKLGGAINSWPLYDDGMWWIQDASSALPAIALCNGLLQKNSKKNDDGNVFSQLHVVDMCSAPGGKCAQLLSAGMGHVTAIEANARRSRRLLENLDRLGYTEARCSVVVSQGQDWYPPQDDGNNERHPISGVLVDVPCSATGTGSKRPDVLRKDPKILEELTKTQETLANHCADIVLQKGGIMVYATCSLLKSESEDQVHKLIARGRDPTAQDQKTKIGVMKTLPFLPGEIPGFDGAIDENGWLRVLPGVLDGELKSCDGFFVARLIKEQ